MANYYATARSNYFAVKDETAFREWADHLGLTIMEPCHPDKDAGAIRRFGITPGNRDDSGSWPTMVWNETGDYEDINVFKQLAAHLADDEVAIMLEVGNEKLRYVTGQAIAVNNKGKIRYVDLNTIYKRAMTLGKNITRAEF